MSLHKPLILPRGGGGAKGESFAAATTPTGCARNGQGLVYHRIRTTGDNAERTRECVEAENDTWMMFIGESTLRGSFSHNLAASEMVRGPREPRKRINPPGRRG